MFGGIKNKINRLRDMVFRRYISHYIVQAMQLDTQRNKVITCDFILEADTSPQDEFELFKYIYEQNNEYFVPYYIINEHCAAYPEIKAKYGDNIIPYSPERIVSFAFYLKELFKTTKYVCGGFQVLHSLCLGITDACKRSPYVYSFFTQHGVTFFKDEFISQSSYSAFLFDKLMISNDFEKKIFMERACYKEENLVKNGLFRWDQLSAEHAPCKKSIFIYFTHRRYLKDMEDIQDTVYVRTIISLLRNKEFNRLIEENGYTVQVALHHTLLHVCGNDILQGVQILKDEEIADAKKNSALLITDYSSMCFEMWFQHKPVIFLNVPDSQDCLTYGHKTDLAAPYSGKEDFIFGVVQTVDECVAQMKQYFANGFRLSEEDCRKRDKFFYYNSGFCARFYQYLVDGRNDTKTLYHLPVNFSMDFARCPDINTYAIELPTPHGRWVVRKKAHFSFFVPPETGDLAIQIRFRPYLRYKQYRFFVKAGVNGRWLTSQEVFTRSIKALVLDVPRSLIGPDGKIEIQFRLSHVYKRKQLRCPGEDRRYLSMQLLTMDLLERDRSVEQIEDQFEAINAERASQLAAQE